MVGFNSFSNIQIHRSLCELKKKLYVALYMNQNISKMFQWSWKTVLDFNMPNWSAKLKVNKIKFKFIKNFNASSELF